MDCCNYGEYRGQAAYGAGAGWDYGHGYPPYPYPHYYPHAHDYPRYYRYEYPPHAPLAPPLHHADHAMPMDYGAYALKEARARRSLARREQRAHSALHFPVSHTPPLECGMSSRGHTYCEPQMWPHYQMNVLAGNGWNGTNGGMWPSRVPTNICSREQVRYGPDCRLLKNPQNHISAHDGRSTPYPVYEQSYESGSKRGSDYSSRIVPATDAPQSVREDSCPKPRSPKVSEEKRPPVVPLPAFQQAFGSTEIGKFAEAFSRAEVTHEVDDSCENFVYEPYNEWEASPENQWTPPITREIKCEENF